MILDSLDRQLDFLGKSVEGKSVDYYHNKAYELLSSNEAKAAFDLTAENDATRERYGRNRYGQSYLLARRLIESGVRMVMVNDNIGTNNDRWDTHSGNFGPLRKHLPQADAGLSSLIEDLRQRGLLDTTLVIWMGEMGRTPTGGHTGHWPQCYSVLMAGGGIKGGRIYGRSDKHASYPAADGCSPGDVIATIYHALGIPAHTTLMDLDDRPIHLYNGKPISQLF